MKLTENMSPEEIRVVKNGVLMALGMLLVSLAMADGDAGEEETEVPEEPEVPEEETEEWEEGSDEEDEEDEGDEGDEDGEDENDEEDEPTPEGKRAWRRVTDEEVERWCEARDNGIPVSEIAREAGRNISLVPAQQPVSDAEDGDEEGEDWVPMREEGAQEMGG